MAHPDAQRCTEGLRRTTPQRGRFSRSPSTSGVVGRLSLPRLINTLTSSNLILKPRILSSNSMTAQAKLRKSLVPMLGFLFLLGAHLAAAQGRGRPEETPQQTGGAGEAFDGPELLSFRDLVQLSSTADPQGALGEKLNTLLATPFISDDASDRGIRPHRPLVNGAGSVLRIAQWNIERGLNFELIRSALTDPAEFQRISASTPGITERQKMLAQSQLGILKDADVLILNEVDLGMKRTEYRDVARELAAATQMNFAFGVEFVELDPLFDLGTEQIHLSDAQLDLRLQEDLKVDTARYRGLHGNAILSRYPIRDARIFRLPVCYDWYGAESRKISHLERTRRWSAHSLFRERMDREIRHGGRMALIVHLAVPDAPTGEITVVATHLENKCPPACRRKQMDALLAEIKDEKSPVVLAGDLNTTSRDNTPTSIRNEIMIRVTDYRFWIKQGISHFHPLGIYQYLLFPAHYFHGYMDPTTLDVPILWESRERGLFKHVEKFRFDDGRAFDFRGRKEFTVNQKQRTLADSNQRASKGFMPTYAFQRDYWGLIGRFKLDWFFVKPFVQNPRARDQSYWFAPRFARTMRELNESVADRVSDHPPMTVDLPLQQPASDPN